MVTWMVLKSRFYTEFGLFLRKNSW